LCTVDENLKSINRLSLIGLSEREKKEDKENCIKNSTFSLQINVFRACGRFGEEKYGTRGFGGNALRNESTCRT
jgi:hypothetical protein